MKFLKLLAIILCFTSCFLIVSASPPQGAEVEALIQSKFTYIISFSNDFDITAGGQAQIASSIVASNVNQVGISARLQQYQSGSWHTIKSWFETKNGTSCTLDESWYVTSGYQYRLYSTGFAYQSNQIVESGSYTSSAIYY